MARGPVNPVLDVPGEAACPPHVPRDPVSGRPRLLVRAVKLGFYPDPGHIRQKERPPGSLFLLRHHREFAGVDEHPVGGWMEWAHLPSEFLDPTSIPMTTAPQMVSDPLRMTEVDNKMPAPGLAPLQPQVMPQAPIAGSQVPGTMPARVLDQGAPAWPVEAPNPPGSRTAGL